MSALSEGQPGNEQILLKVRDEETKAEVIRKSMDRKEADDIMDILLENQEFREVFLRKVEMYRRKII